MTENTFADETLMAYADGELDPETARALDAALQTDAALAARLRLFTGTREALAAGPAEPLPEALVARVRATLDAARRGPEDKIPPFRRAPEPAAAPPRWQPMALAASLALAVGLGAGFLVGTQRGTKPADALRLVLLEAPGLAEALDDLPSGESRALAGGAVSAIASFRNAQDALCREFEFDDAGGGGVVAVACHDGAAWQTRLAVATPPRDGQSYAPASSLDTLEAFLSASGAGPALSAEDEASALAGLQD